MWSFGSAKSEAGNLYRFQVKHYGEGSQFGINGGRVSKLWIADRDGRCVVNYDRGWDVKPEEGSEVYEVMMDVIRKYN